MNSVRVKKRILTNEWASKTMVYEMLCQYYVHQSSVVFIVDQNYDSEWHKDKAYQLMQEQFKKLD